MQTVARERFLEKGAENILSCSQIAKHLYQPEMFNGSSAHSLVIEFKRRSRGEAPSRRRQGGSGGRAPVLSDFWDLLPK